MARNPKAGEMTVASGARLLRDLYTFDTEVDYRGLDVSPEVLEAILLGENTTHETPDGSPSISLPSHRRLPLHRDANVLLYMTGHGGEGFLKFHDKWELTYRHLSSILDKARDRGRFRRLLIVADTCKAASALTAQKAQGVFGIASSSRGEDSYSHTWDAELGLATSDGFSYHLVDLLSKIPGPDEDGSVPPASMTAGSSKHKGGDLGAHMSVRQLFDRLGSIPIRSTVKVRTDLLGIAEGEVLDGGRVVDFFAACGPPSAGHVHTASAADPDAQNRGSGGRNRRNRR